VKFEYTGRFFRIVFEVFHRNPAIPRRLVAARRHGDEFRRKLLRKVIHKIGMTKAVRRSCLVKTPTLQHS